MIPLLSISWNTRSFFKDTLLENLLGMNQIVFTMYTNNDTIVKGGKVGNIEDLKETQAYQKLNQSGETKGFFFVYDKNRSGTAEERKVVFLQKLDFFFRRSGKNAAVGI